MAAWFPFSELEILAAQWLLSKQSGGFSVGQDVLTGWRMPIYLQVEEKVNGDGGTLGGGSSPAFQGQR